MKTRNITKMDKLLKDMKSDAGRAYSVLALTACRLPENFDFSENRLQPRLFVQSHKKACLLALPQTSLKRLPPYVGTKDGFGSFQKTYFDLLKVKEKVKP